MVSLLSSSSQKKPHVPLSPFLCCVSNSKQSSPSNNTMSGSALGIFFHSVIIPCSFIHASSRICCVLCLLNQRLERSEHQRWSVCCHLTVEEKLTSHSHIFAVLCVKLQTVELIKCNIEWTLISLFIQSSLHATSLMLFSHICCAPMLVLSSKRVDKAEHQRRLVHCRFPGKGDILCPSLSFCCAVC